jgi:cysteine desulfurase
MNRHRRIYLDYAAATPLAPEAIRAMRRSMKHVYGNPSALHAEGQRARNEVEAARVSVARCIKVRPELVTFTSGGTESNNLAMVGVVEAYAAAGRAYTDMEVLTTTLEHPSITTTLTLLQKRGVRVRYLPVRETGQIDLAVAAEYISPETVIVSTSYVNSEIGTIQPLHRLKQLITAAEKKFGRPILLHVDAAQAPYWLSCQPDALGADLLALDFGKCGGPKGVGVLVRTRRVSLAPVVGGGGQEAGLRPGTEAVIAIMGGAAAFIAAQSGYRARAERVSATRDAAITFLTAVDKHIVLNGAKGTDRVANNINISIPGIDTEFLAVVLDTHGIAVSTKSACAGAGGGESAVVKTISNDAARASSTLRLTLGPTSSIRDIKKVASVIETHLKKMAPWQQT